MASGEWSSAVPASGQSQTSRLSLLGPGEVLAHLRRQALLMGAIFGAFVLIGLFAALMIKPTYQAHSSLLVRLGQEYVYQPGVGDAARGATPDNDQIVQSELEILSSSVLKDRVIHDIGYGRMFPKQAGAYARAGEPQRHRMEAAAIKSIESGLKFASAPDTSVVRLTYVNSDPEMSALVLNTLVDEYLVYRRSVLAGGQGAAVLDQKRALEQRLHAADQAYDQFLADNHIGDMETEKASVAASYGQLVSESYAVQAQLAEAVGGASASERLARAAPPEIGLYHDLDHTAADRLSQLKLERQEMASRYQPGAQPLRDKDAQIAALEGLAASAGNGAGGSRRVGVNPIWQTLQTERFQNEARAASLRSRAVAITRDLEALTARRQKLAALEPQYQALSRDRDILSNNVRALAARAEEMSSQQALSARGADNIRVAERAYVPARGVSLKAPVLALCIFLGGVSAISVGLISLVRGKAYPSREAVERALGLPVLAATPVQA